MTEHTIEDDYGRKTTFTGERLVHEHTDTDEGRKPQWLEVTVWRTAGGNWVVRRTTQYRIVHADEECSRADGYVLTRSTAEDTYRCRTCNQHGASGWAQAPRVTVDSYTQPQALVDSFADQNGHYSHLARAILADLADVDERIDGVWSTVHVP